MKCFHVVVENTKTGRREKMTATPTSLRSAGIIASKLMTYPKRRVILEPAKCARRKR